MAASGAAQAPVLAGLVGGAGSGGGVFAVGELVAGGEEVLLEAGEGDGGGDLVGGFEAGAAVEGGVVVGGGVPVVGGGGEGPSDADGVAVGVDPADQAGPFAQQGFVGDFDGGFAGDGVVVGDDEPVGPVARR